MRLHSLEIPVQDMDRACSFYSDVLRFPAVSRRGSEIATFFLGDVHGGMVTLVRAEAVADGVVFVLEVDEDIDGARSSLEERGARFLGPTEARGLGRVAYLRDSEGNRIGIHQRSWPPSLREFADIPMADVPGRLDALAARTVELLAGVSEDAARREPAPGEWTAIDQLGHITDSLRSGGEIVTELAHGRQAPIGGLWQAGYPAASLDAAMAESRDAFAEAHGWLAQLPESPDPAARLVHGVFGALNSREWVGFTLFHVALHLNQIEALKTES